VAVIVYVVVCMGAQFHRGNGSVTVILTFAVVVPAAFLAVTV
jgi:hypothetical protein